MNRFRILIYFIVLTASVKGQNFQVHFGDTMNRKDINGLKQGLWRKYYRTDTLCSETFFKDDQPQGTSRTWYESGKLKAEVQPVGKIKLSYCISYFESGKVLAKGFYRNQQKDSTWIYYHENSDSISAIEHYKNGLKNGNWKVFYKSGILAHELNYINGSKEGVVKEYNEDGKLIFEIQYKNGKENGLSVLYYGDEKLRERGLYKNGERDGKWQQYDEQGVLKNEMTYKNGVEVNKK